MALLIEPSSYMVDMHTITVEVIYALPQRVWRKSLTIARGVTPLELIEASGVMSEFSDLTLTELSYGVYGQRINNSYLLVEGDRLEIYRPLTADPKQVRREMAKVGKTMTDNR